MNGNEHFLKWKSLHADCAKVLLREVCARFRLKIGLLQDAKAEKITLKVSIFPSVELINRCKWLESWSPIGRIEVALKSFQSFCTDDVIANDDFFALCKSDQGSEYLSKYAYDEMQFSLKYEPQYPPAFFARPTSGSRCELSFDLNSTANNYSGYGGRTILSGFRFACVIGNELK